VKARQAGQLAATIAGRAGAIKAAPGIAAAVIGFVVLLLIIGLFVGDFSTPAAASACGERGTPSAGDSADSPPPKIRRTQIKHAKTINTIAEEGKLSGRAVLIALMTALQESSLLNVGHGDRDSLGLFQQRPSQGWGTAEQIMRPRYAATMFFFGDKDGSPRGLVDVKGWQRMPLGQVAQAVQVSGHPGLYADQEVEARKIATAASIDVERPGEFDNPRPKEGETGQHDGESADRAAPSTRKDCYPGTQEESRGGKGAFHDGAAGWPTEVRNPRSTAQAIKWARQEAATGGKQWFAMCLAFVARTYGWNSSGVHYAIDHYRQMPQAMRHDKDRRPPPGALMYWDTGKRAGHVAIYLGDGKIASNDIQRPGYIDIVSAGAIETKWGATYEGWAPPYFPNGG
jgi:hypothetical protein